MLSRLYFEPKLELELKLKLKLERLSQWLWTDRIDINISIEIAALPIRAEKSRAESSFQAELADFYFRCSTFGQRRSGYLCTLALCDVSTSGAHFLATRAPFGFMRFAFSLEPNESEPSSGVCAVRISAERSTKQKALINIDSLINLRHNTASYLLACVVAKLN